MTAQEMKKGSRKQVQGKPVLVFEPNPMIRKIARTMLKSLGYDVTNTERLDDVFEKATRGTWRAVLFSVDLEGEDPGTRLQELSKILDQPETTIIPTTSLGRQDLFESTTPKGLTSILSYPARVEDLQNCLQDDSPAAPIIGDTPTIDNHMLSSIRELSEGDEEDFLNSIIDIFFERVPILLQEIRDALQAKDAHKFERSSHSLKGSCGNMGAASMMKLCEHLEARGREDQLAGVEPLLLCLEEIYTEVREILDKDWRVS